MGRFRCAWAIGAAFATLAASPSGACEGPAEPPLLHKPELATAMEPRLLREQLALSGAVALVAIPAMMGVGTLLGRASSNLYAAALPALLLYLVVPPALTAKMAQFVGSKSLSVSPGFFLPALAGLGVHLAATAAGVLLNVSTNQPWLALFLAAVDALAMASTTVFAMNALAAPRASNPPSADLPVSAAEPAPASAKPLLRVSFDF